MYRTPGDFGAKIQSVLQDGVDILAVIDVNTAQKYLITDVEREFHEDSNSATLWIKVEEM